MTDPIGNSASNPSSVTVDLVPPSDPVINMIREGDESLSGTGDVGTTITLTTDNPGGPTVTCTNAPVIVATNGEWTCNMPSPAPLEDDIITAISTDEATNASTPINSTVLPADATPPNAPTIDPVTEGDATITGVAEPNVVVDLSGSSPSITCTNAPVTASAAGFWSCTPAVVPTGDDIISATVTDPATNTSTVATTTVAGTGEIEPPAIDPVSAGDTNITGTATPNASITLTTDGVGGPSITCANDPVEVDSSGNWYCETPSPVPAEGDVISATQTITSSTSGAVTTTVSNATNIAPPSPLVDPTNGTSVAGTTIPNGLIDIIDITTGTTLCSTTANASGVYSCAPLAPATTDGQEIVAVVTDPATNSTSNPALETIDAQIPAAPVITAPIASEYVKNTTTVSGTCETGATVSISNADLLPNPTTDVCSSGVFAIDVTWLPPADGSLETLSVTQTDPAGNTSPADTVDVNVDLSTPAAPSIVFPVSSGSTDGTVSGTGAEPNATIIVTVQGTGETCSVMVAGDGSWSCDLSPTPSMGAATIEATATDEAGNTSLPTTLATTIDTLAPASPTVNFPTLNGPTDGTVSGTGAEPNSTITVEVAGTGETCSVTVAGDGSWSCDLSPTPSEGPVVLEVVATDPAGNSSGTTLVPASVDTTNPADPVITTPSDNDPDNNTTTVSGTCEANATVSITNALLTPNPTTTVCETDSTFDIEVTWQAAADGNTETLTVTQTDVAGNNSTGNDTVDVNVDLTAPVAPVITSHVDNDPDNNPTTLEGTCETDALVIIGSVNLTTNPTQSTCVGGTYSVDLTWKI